MATVQKQQEDFLHYLWRYQYFEKSDLKTVGGDVVEVLHPGFWNVNAGPDFLNARLLIGGIQWHGHVEIHRYTGDWFAHKHHEDKAYDSVVLHVVWSTKGVELSRTDGSPIEQLELTGRVNMQLVEKYQTMLEKRHFIACEHLLTDEVMRYFPLQLEKALAERMEEKAAQVISLYEKNERNWEETAYQVLAQSFGFKVNKQTFLDLAQLLPIKILKKHQDQLLQLEALLFGVGGFLDDAKDSYQEQLKSEFEFLRHKYGLSATLSPEQWKYSRLRPPNFPEIRIAQLAQLIHITPHFLETFVGDQDARLLIQKLRVKQSIYWQMHYGFGKTSNAKISSLGANSAENLIINTLVPLRLAYLRSFGGEEDLLPVVELLEQLKAENNGVVNQWKALGLTIKTAYQSQSALQQYNRFCKDRRCLECTIGSRLLRPQS